MRLVAAFLLSVAFAAPFQTAQAESHRRCPYIGAVSADAKGRVIFSDGADRQAYPASLTKLMTALLVVEDVRAGKYAFTTRVTATPDVYRCEPSWIGIKPGESMSVRDLLLALMVESANDAAIALGVHSAGSLDAFVERMNSRAAALGMKHTKYWNPNGLPPNASKRYPWKEFNVSTAADQLKLAVALVGYPEIFEFTKVKDCDLIKTHDGYRVSICGAVNRPRASTKLGAGEKIVKHLANHNNVMVKDKLKLINPDKTEAVDGLKTGYIDAGGSSIVMTGCRRGTRAIVVVLGSDRELDSKGRTLKKSAAVRDETAKRLLEDALGALVW